MATRPRGYRADALGEGIAKTLTPGAYVVAALSLLAVSFLVFQIVVRRTYLRHGRLGVLVGVMQALVWFPFFTFPYLYNPQDWAWFWTHAHPIGPGTLVTAVALILIGLGGLGAAFAQVGFQQAVGARATALRHAGLYRLTRNPQLVAGAPLVVGLALLWPSWYALGWIAIYAAMSHMMVLTEEAHLEQRYGQAYVSYCARVPRYLGRGRRSSGRLREGQ